MAVIGVKTEIIKMRPLHEVASDDKTRQKSLKKRSLHGVNEHLLVIYNAVMLSVVIVQRSQDDL
jgi:hypothetical protein